MRARRLIARCAALFALAGPVAADVAAARYDAPTTRYAHGVLGDAVEWGALVLTLSDARQLRITLPEARVFEDLAPRVIDLGNGQRAAMVVESHRDTGARLALYGGAGLIAATPHIGQTHRWLAPIGAGDLDGDGRVEIAYIDRPHLAKRLRVWRFDAGALSHVADHDGLSNHRIGWDYIIGGLRDCGSGPEMITASGDWSRVMAATLAEGAITLRPVAPYEGPGSVEAALDCRSK